MRKPNFFIVGAPKCGTTALYTYLRRHPNIFMARDKEPQFFASDTVGDPSYLLSFDQYMKLFAKASGEHIVIGEASTRYLFSEVAIQKIFEFNKKAKLVAMVRNPVDYVYSFHSQQLWDLNDDEEDFEAAWRLQESRRRGENIPETCLQPRLLQYGEIGALGMQVQRMLSIFPQEQVKIIVFDDLVSDTLSVYKSVLEFLGLNYDGRRKFPKVNVSKSHRSYMLARLLYRSPAPLKAVVEWLKRLFGVHRTRIAAVVLKTFGVPKRRKPLSPEFRKELIEFFSNDVELLSNTLERDLSSWLE